TTSLAGREKKCRIVHCETWFGARRDERQAGQQRDLEVFDQVSRRGGAPQRGERHRLERRIRDNEQSFRSRQLRSDWLEERFVQACPKRAQLALVGVGPNRGVELAD